MNSFLLDVRDGVRQLIRQRVVAIMLALSGCLAALLPAMRGARVDPASSLRAE
jgi:ABC-type lipoprotein release transport system permease subunit